MRATVSICLPTLNAARFLKERMHSILNQTMSDWELIICDSDSTDGTWEYLQRFNSDPRIRLYRVAKEGLYAGWNECLKRAQGEYVYIATADDTMSEHCLDTLIAPLRANPDIGIAVGAVDFVDEAGSLLPTGNREIHRFLKSYMVGPWIRIRSESAFLMLAAFGWGLGSVTGFVFRRSLLASNRAGLFPTDLSYLGDCEWALRAVLCNDIAWTSLPVATWRRHTAQASHCNDIFLESWFFRESLRRVLDDPDSIPARIHSVQRWQSLLMAPRTRQLEMATLLVWDQLRKSPSAFFSHLLRAVRLCPLVALSRVLSGFRCPRTWSASGADFFNRWIPVFGTPWPPEPITGCEPPQ